MVIQKFHYLIFLIIVIAICCLFTVKDKVAILDYQLSSVNKQIKDENNNIHVLKAEKAYLIAPARLKKLALSYLQLETVKSYQMIKNPLAKNDKKFIKFDNNISKNIDKKWRYKRINNSKYIQTVSSRATKP